MSQKLMPRLGSAMASTILSLFWAVSWGGVDKAQAALFTYSINRSNLSFFKVNTSSLTGIGEESIAVSEGRFYAFTLGSLFEGSKKYYDLAQTSIAVFDQGELLGLNAYGSDYGTRESIIPPEEGGPYYILWSASASWSINTYRTSLTTWTSVLNGYSEQYSSINGGSFELTDRSIYRDDEVDYTLVDIAPEPVPEPLTAGGTALGLAGLSWLKQKKKMAG